MTRVFDFFKEHDVEYKRNYNLSNLSSIKIGGAAELIAYPRTADELVLIVEFLKKLKIRYKILGRATNILFDDEGYQGALISTSRMDRISYCGEFFSAECGVSLARLILEAYRRGYGGSENLIGIPASLGGALYNNAGAYGMNISDCLNRAVIYSLDSRGIVYMSREDMEFSYRSSILQRENLILLSADFRFREMPTENIKENIERVKSLRMERQPRLPSLGSVFKRYGDIAVSRLIDELGMKGTAVGDAKISSKHAGFIVNTGAARASDVKTLIELIKEKIYEHYGFVPIEEIEIL